MVEELAVRYLSDRQLVRDSMRSHPSTANPNLSVSALVPFLFYVSGTPNPTRPKFRFAGRDRARLVHLGPKSLRQHLVGNLL
jgi:hypothetical protein